jgi:hypothetical protein
MSDNNHSLRPAVLVAFIFLFAFIGGTLPGRAASLPAIQATPTADPCGPAIARPRNAPINVRTGPGINYPVLVEDSGGEMPVLGRHHAFRWWQVSLPNGQIGWVADEVAAVTGYVAGVALVEAPEINGFVPDLNEEWTPFVQVPCAATPLPTVAEVLLPTRSATVTAIGLLEESDDVWLPPLNLSQSGVARNPVIVVESAGNGHLIWQEGTANNFFYVRGRDGEWSTPVEVELPFGTRRFYAALREDEPTPLFVPQLLVDGAGQIHALWLDKEGSLFYSQVASDNFANYDSWSARRQLAEGVVAFDAALDGSARLHLTYISARELPTAPAGVYYLQTDIVQASPPQLLSSSRYFRALPAEQANLQIALADGDAAAQLYVGWDNRPLDTLYLVSSADGGQTWGDVTIVDQLSLDDSPQAMTPSSMMVATSGGGVLLLWQADHEGTGCRQYYRWFGGGGQSWQGPHLLETLPGCYTHGQLLSGENGSILLLAHLEEGTYLLAWDGEAWSEPQLQEALTAFVNAGTLRTVRFDCYRGAFQNDHLLVVGCSSGEVNDIWVTARDVESTAAWFTPPVWSDPEPITSDNVQVADLKLVATSDGMIHAFFSQPQDPSVYYTRWDGAGWSRVTLALKVQEGEAGWPVVAVGPDDELLLIVRSSGGSLYFSLANSSEAVAATGWSEVAAVQIEHNGNVSPADVVWDANGTIYVAYSVPVNDARGVYLVQSTDQGRSWTEPLQLFNGATANFNLVGSPSLLKSADGSLHVAWQEQALPVDGVSRPVSLYYARSEDGGLTFSNAELVVETPVAWHEIMADGMGNLHLLWQQPDVPTTVWNRVSVDRGRSWQDVQGLPTEWRATTVTADPAGQLHLIGVGAESLGHRLWNGNQWQTEVSLRWPLAVQTGEPKALLAAVVNGEGEMVVALPVMREEAGDELLYTSSLLNLPPLPGPVEVVATRPVVPVATAAAPDPEPSATPAGVETETEGGSGGGRGFLDRIITSNPVTQFAVAFSPVIVLLLVVLGRMALRAVRVKPR